MKAALQDIKRTVSEFKPSTRQLQLFGFVLTAIFVIYAFVADDPAVFSVLAFVAFLFAYYIPSWYLPPLKVLMVLLAPIGFVLSRLLLVLFFYLIITVLGRTAFLLGHDPLLLKKRTQRTYWRDIEKNKHPTRMSL